MRERDCAALSQTVPYASHFQSQRQRSSLLLSAGLEYTFSKAFPSPPTKPGTGWGSRRKKSLFIRPMRRVYGSQVYNQNTLFFLQDWCPSRPRRRSSRPCGEKTLAAERTSSMSSVSSGTRRSFFRACRHSQAS